MKKKIALFLGLAVSALCLGLILRKQDFGELATVFGSLKWGWVAACVAIFYLSMPVLYQSLLKTLELKRDLIYKNLIMVSENGYWV